MKKTFIKIIFLSTVALTLSSCNKNTNTGMKINGQDIDVSLINTGYYFDIASLSETQLVDMIERIQPIDMPSDMGEVVFNGELKSITINTTTPSQVTSQDVEAAIEKKRDRYKETKIVEEKRGCKIGDTIVIDISAEDENGEIIIPKQENQEIVLGNGQIEEELEKGIIGKKSGVEFKVKTTLPNDIEDKSLRGKKVTYTCFVKYIKEVVTPAFDDEFALLHSRIGATSSQAYRKELEKDEQLKLENVVIENEKNNLMNEIYKIIKDIKPTEKAKAWYFGKQMMEQKRLAELMDKSIQEMLTQGQYPLYDAMMQYKQTTQINVAENMILDYLQKRYNISYTEKDKYEWFKKLCIVNDYGDDVTYELYKNSMGEVYIDDNAKKDKILSETLKHIKKIYFTSEELEQQIQEEQQRQQELQEQQMQKMQEMQEMER